MYRLEGWEQIKKRLCAKSLGQKRACCSTCPAKPMTCDINGEALVDAMLEGLLKMAEESPSGTFVIYSKEQHIYCKPEGL